MFWNIPEALQKNYLSILHNNHDLMKSSRKFYGMHVIMTKKSGDFQKLIITTTITHNTTNVDTLICHVQTTSFILASIGMDIWSDSICSELWTGLGEGSLRKTVSFKEFTVFKDKNTSIFSCQLETIIVFFILQTFFVTHGKKC